MVDRKQVRNMLSGKQAKKDSCHPNRPPYHSRFFFASMPDVENVHVRREVAIHPDCSASADRRYDTAVSKEAESTGASAAL